PPAPGTGPRYAQLTPRLVRGRPVDGQVGPPHVLHWPTWTSLPCCRRYFLPGSAGPPTSPVPHSDSQARSRPTTERQPNAIPARAPRSPAPTLAPPVGC